jgi:hypothetical protein
MLAQTEHERGDGLERLQRDLNDGTWATRHRALLDQAEFDCGYRIAVGLAEAHAVWQALLVWRFPAAPPADPVRGPCDRHHACNAAFLAKPVVKTAGGRLALSVA